MALWPQAALAQNAAAPTGQFVTITSPVDDVLYARISNAALKLQAETAQTGRRAVLVLQIMPGSSPFHQVQGLANFLSSGQINQVTTVAWIPENLTGVHALLALACREIVMPEGVQFGDIGRGVRLEPAEEQVALALSQKRINPRVNAALVHGLVDPQQEIFQIRVQTGAAQPESRTVTRAELDALRAMNSVIEEAVVIKEPGTPGLFTGKAARGWDVLVTHLAENRAAVADLYSLPRDAQREDSPEGNWSQVRLIRVQGVIDPMLESFLVRQIHQAVDSGVQILIFELDSPNGHLLPSINLAFKIAEQDPQRVRTVAYVPETAFSGAALVAMACDEVYLRPTARWGSATPAQPREAQLFDRSPDKIAQLKINLKTLAEKKGRPAALAQAMADRSLIVFQTTNQDNGRVWYHTAEELHTSHGEWAQGPQIPETDGAQSLVVDGRRAAELKLAEPPVDSFDELKSRLGIAPTIKITRAEPNWTDQLVFILNRPEVTVLLLVLAVALLYLELHFTTTLLGILSVLCFVLFFWSKVLGGTAGWLEVILFVLGLGCLAIEAFLVPGFGIFGVSGIVLILSSLIMASQTFGNLEPYADWNQLASSFGTVFAALVAIGFLGVGLSRLLPRLPFFDNLILSPPGMSVDSFSEPQLRREDAPADAEAETALPLGVQGIALSMLRPAGKAQVGDRVIDVVSDGPFIAAGSTLEIVSIAGNRVVVRQL